MADKLMFKLEIKQILMNLHKAAIHDCKLASQENNFKDHGDFKNGKTPQFSKDEEFFRNTDVSLDENVKTSFANSLENTNSQKLAKVMYGFAREKISISGYDQLKNIEETDVAKQKPYITGSSVLTDDRKTAHKKFIEYFTKFCGSTKAKKIDINNLKFQHKAEIKDKGLVLYYFYIWYDVGGVD